MGDIDLDGDTDIVATDSLSDHWMWFEQNHDQGTSFTIHHFTNESEKRVARTFGIAMSDIDLDGDLDVCTTGYLAYPISSNVNWWKNNFTGNTTSTPLFQNTSIYQNAAGANNVQSTDIDQDGDIDIVVTAYFSQKVILLENSGGDYPQFLAHPFSTGTSFPTYSAVGDIQNNGHQSIVTSDLVNHKITYISLPFIEFTSDFSTTEIGKVSAIDPDGDPINYSIDDGDDAKYFNIDENGTITFTPASTSETNLDMESPDKVFEFYVTASDGSSSIRRLIKVKSKI